MYASSAAAFLGARVRIFGNVGDDFPGKILERLDGRGMNLSLVRHVHGPSTRFRIAYADGSRKLWLLQPGQGISRSWPGNPVLGVHLAPVFNEISGSLVRSVRRSCKFLSLDIHGLVRGVSTSGLVQTVRRDLRGILKLCDLVKASMNEARGETSTKSPMKALDAFLAAGPEYAIVTLGSKGSILGIKYGGKFLIPAFPERNIVDPTGAGDVLVGSWLRTYLWTKDPVWASSVGSAFASITSRKRGLSKFTLSRNELLRRTAWVYSNVKTLETG